MWLWGLAIDTSALVLLTIAMGIAVDYSAHITHTFMTMTTDGPIPRDHQTIVRPTSTNGPESREGETIGGPTSRDIWTIDRPTSRNGPTVDGLTTSRDGRTVATLVKIGPAVFNGGFSTFLAVSLLATSCSHIFKVMS